MLVLLVLRNIFMLGISMLNLFFFGMEIIVVFYLFSYLTLFID
jgi:hypothetical protein